MNSDEIADGIIKAVVRMVLYLVKLTLKIAAILLGLALLGIVCLFVYGYWADIQLFLQRQFDWSYLIVATLCFGVLATVGERLASLANNRLSDQSRKWLKDLGLLLFSPFFFPVLIAPFYGLWALWAHYVNGETLATIFSITNGSVMAWCAAGFVMVGSGVVSNHLDERRFQKALANLPADWQRKSIADALEGSDGRLNTDEYVAKQQMKFDERLNDGVRIGLPDAVRGREIYIFAI